MADAPPIPTSSLRDSAELHAHAREVFAEFDAGVWRYIWTPDREVEADDWQMSFRFTRRGERPPHPVGRWLRREGAKPVTYRQTLTWTETGSTEGLPRPRLRFDVVIEGPWMRLSRTDRRLIEGLLREAADLPEPWSRVNVVWSSETIVRSIRRASGTGASTTDQPGSCRT